MLEQLKEQTRTAVEELLAAAKLKPKDLVVLGASSSEIMGKRIGSFSSLEAAEAVFGELYRITQEHKLYLAVQCCEHLNRALILEEEAARMFRYDIVNVVPQLHAGGAFAVTAYEAFQHPAAVEAIRADAGIDIGQTFIGMHMKPVAVPVRVSVKQIGEAAVSFCRTRPKYIGGPRAQYNEALL